MGLLISIVNTSNHTKCVSLSNQKVWFNLLLLIYILMYSLISQECHYYSLAVKLERYVGSCNTLNGFSNKLYVPNKTEGSNRSNFNVITGINESKTLTKYISCKFKVNLIEENVIQINCGIMINVDVSIKTSYICKN